MLLAGFFFTVMNVFVKMLVNIPAIEIVWFRSIVSFILSLSILLLNGIYPWGKNKFLLVLRGLTGAFALILYFELLQRIPLASAVTLSFLTPIFTTLFGLFIVREKVQPLQWFFYFLSFAGILLVKGFDTRISMTDFLIGIGAAIFSGLAQNLIRKIRNNEHPLVIILYFPLITIPITGTLSAFYWKIPQHMEWLILILVGIFTQLAQYYMTKAYQHEEISKISNLQYLNIVYAMLFGFLLFNETFNIYTYLGMLMAISGVVFNLVHKKKNTTA